MADEVTQQAARPAIVVRTQPLEHRRHHLLVELTDRLDQVLLLPLGLIAKLGDQSFAEITAAALEHLKSHAPQLRALRGERPRHVLSAHRLIAQHLSHQALLVRRA